MKEFYEKLFLIKGIANENKHSVLQILIESFDTKQKEIYYYLQDGIPMTDLWGHRWLSKWIRSGKDEMAIYRWCTRQFDRKPYFHTSQLDRFRYPNTRSQYMTLNCNSNIRHILLVLVSIICLGQLSIEACKISVMEFCIKYWAILIFLVLYVQKLPWPYETCLLNSIMVNSKMVTFCQHTVLFVKKALYVNML